MSKRTITTAGIGRAKVVPTKLRVTLGVESKATGAAEALRALWADLESITTVLTEAGVPAADRQMASLSVSAGYNHEGQPDGYVASCQVNATLPDPAAAAAAIDAAAQRIGDRFRLNQTWWVAEPTPEHIAEARAHAVADALAAAQQLASAAGATLGPLRTIIEGGRGGLPAPWPGPMRAMRSLGAGADLDPGEVGFAIMVEVVHDLA